MGGFMRLPPNLPPTPNDYGVYLNPLNERFKMTGCADCYVRSTYYPAYYEVICFQCKSPIHDGYIHSTMTYRQGWWEHDCYHRDCFHITDTDVLPCNK